MALTPMLFEHYKLVELILYYGFTKPSLMCTSTNEQFSFFNSILKNYINIFSNYICLLSELRHLNLSKNRLLGRSDDDYVDLKYHDFF